MMSSTPYNAKIYFSAFTNIEIRIVENEVVFLNGTTQKFYSIGDIYESSSIDNWSWGGSVYAQARIFMSEEYNRYTQYEISEVDDTTRRNLDTTTTVNGTTTTTTTTTETIDTDNRVNTTNTTTSMTSKEEEEIDGDYYKLYFISQLGGLFALCQIVLGFFLGCYSQKARNHDAVNLYNSSIRYSKLKATYNKSIGKIKPMENPSNAYKLESQPLINEKPKSFTNQLQNSKNAQNMVGSANKPKSVDSKVQMLNTNQVAYDSGSNNSNPKAIDGQAGVQLVQETYTSCDFLYYVFCCCKGC